MAVLEGTRELTAALRSLPEKVQKKVLRASAMAGARIVRDQVKQFAPVSDGLRRTKAGLKTPGTLKRAIRIKYAPEKSNTEQATYVVTLRRGKNEQKKNRDAFYWLWVERGHRVVGRSKRVIGHAPKHPFFEPAYNMSKDPALKMMRTRMEAETAVLIRGLNSGTS